MVNWWKSIGNPLYQNIELPTTEISKQALQKTLDGEVEKILETSTVTNGYYIRKMDEKTREEFEVSLYF